MGSHIFAFALGGLCVVFLITVMRRGIAEGHALSAGTIVYLRSTSTPVQHWEARVLYDHWGTPYVEGDGRRAMYGNTVLHPHGHTDNTYSVRWLHKSGPPVSFGNRPSDPFSDLKG